jgi:hypothetical protein
MKEVKNIGMIFEAIQDDAIGQYRDPHIAKDNFQKVQVMELFIMVFIMAGSGFCFMAVSS